MAGEETSKLNIHPMEQFIVKPLFGGDAIHWYTPTNVTLWMGIAVLGVIALLVLGTSRRSIIPSRLQSVGEMLYGFIHNMVEEVTGHEGVKYFPYVMTLFMFIVLANLLGLIPGSFSTTSHFAVTATLALLVFLTVPFLALQSRASVFWACSGCHPPRWCCARSSR